MCGIAGFFGRFAPELLDKMIAAISHRGPDDHGIWLSPSKEVGLAHVRLSIIDLSPDGHQPMTNETGSLQLVFNGEIYNFLELRQELEKRGHRFKSKTDSEVLLHLYEDEKYNFLARLNGIFAFVIWDSENEELFFARDQLGVKPLYISETPFGFLFASEMKAIVQESRINRDIDVEALNQYVTFLWSIAPKTMLKNVEKLPPGCAGRVKNGKIVKKWCWYKLPFRGVYLPDNKTVISDRLAEYIETAVKRQLIADVPVGAFLSGGLDSSAVVAMMRRSKPQEKIVSYCIGFHDTQDTEGCPNDLPYARQVAKHLNVDLREIIVTPERLISRLAELVYFLDEPQADPAPINAMFIAEQAKKDGIKVLLSGAGGDDLFSGYRRHVALYYERFWAWLPRPVRRLLFVVTKNLPGAAYPCIRRLKKAFSNAHLDKKERLASYYKWSPDDIRMNLFSKRIREIMVCKPEEALLNSLLDIPNEKDELHQMLFLDIKHFLADHNLNYTDKTTMRYGVETRVPLLDLDLVAFSTTIAPNLKQQGSLGKAIFKKSMEPFLPKEIIYREKTGFGVPLRKWLKSDLRELLEEFLSERVLKSRDIFDSKAVHNLIKLDSDGIVDATYTIFSILCIEIWCQIFLDNRPYWYIM